MVWFIFWGGGEVGGSVDFFGGFGLFFFKGGGTWIFAGGGVKVFFVKDIPSLGNDHISHQMGKRKIIDSKSALAKDICLVPWRVIGYIIYVLGRMEDVGFH